MKKATGIIRRIDDLGRIVIPKELRKTHDIGEGDPLEFYVTDKDEIILKKYEPGCTFCGKLEDLYESNGKHVCKGCINTFAVAVRKG